jgi:hypothetical protein
MVGTAAAQNTLYSFVRNKMIENHELSLSAERNYDPCGSEQLMLLASVTAPNKEFDCYYDEYFLYHCKVNEKGEYTCVLGNKNNSLFRSLKLSLASGDLVTARSKGANVSASTEGRWNGYYFPASDGILNGPSCWVANKGHSEWYQYSFDTVVNIVEVQT